MAICAILAIALDRRDILDGRVILLCGVGMGDESVNIQFMALQKSWICLYSDIIFASSILLKSSNLLQRAVLG